MNDHPLKVEHHRITSDGESIASKDYEDRYFQVNGFEESKEVYIDGNNLEERWESFSGSCFTIGELGFGLGLNFLTMMHCWLKKERSFNLDYIGIDKKILEKSNLIMLEEAFPNLKNEIKVLKECDIVGHNGFECISIPDLKIRLILITEDIQKAINDICVSNIDAWFLDGFDPKKNPEMWEEDILKTVFDLSSCDSSFSSFTSVGRIRRALLENGFEVSKVSGFGTKRHRIIGKKFIENKKSNGIKKIAILGAGLSGSNLAFNLANANIEVDIYDALADLNKGSSGGPIASMYPKFSLDNSPRSKFLIASYFFSLNFYIKNLGFENTGLLFYGSDEIKDKWISKILTLGRDDLFELLNDDEVENFLGVSEIKKALHVKKGLYLQPLELKKKLLEHRFIKIIPNEEFVSFSEEKSKVVVDFKSGLRKSYDALAVCTGKGLKDFNDNLKVSYGLMAGISNKDLFNIKKPLNHQGYIIPKVDGTNWIGSTYEQSPDLKKENIEEKIKLNHAIFGRKGMSFEIHDIWEGERVSARSNLPIASKIPETKNIYCIGGLGSRGLSYAPFLAEIVSSAIQDKQIPLSKEIFSLLNI
ncbi:tRNA (5-methylaminomethyl-2-thiouridine)(34)-methyltransferase MnmD [Pseudomonadota bacterium]|nr:tRNA (5-methylaminomethyl-2-thiouridine)(34)-methyltransferase MnmD [Pseudomonadota bacterium]